MTTATQNYTSVSAVKNPQNAPLTLAAVIAAVFMVDLRESLAAKSSADQSDAALVYGL